MMRRSLVFAVVALLALGVGPTSASHLKEQPRKHKVVYHLSEAGVKARFVLGNIQNGAGRAGLCPPAALTERRLLPRPGRLMPASMR
jgi:hypothetical protein